MSEYLILIPIVLFTTLRLTTPLLLAALGGLFSERSGVINIALEGLMLAGAFTAAAMTFYTGSPWVGLLCGMTAGGLLAWIYALFVIKFKADQVVAGTAIILLLGGLPGFLSGALFLSTGSTPQIPKEHLMPIFPVVLAFVMVGVTWYVINKTPFGLRLRATGENPSAADAAGINVQKIRYMGVIISGVLAGIGGAYLSIGQSSLFTRNMTAGRGFIALAALIFGKWRPVQTMLACLLFGFTEALTIQIQGVQPLRIWILIIGLPIFITALVLFIFYLSKKKTNGEKTLRFIIFVSVSVLVFLFIGRYIVKAILSVWREWRGFEQTLYWFDRFEIPVQFIQIIPYVLTIIVLAGFIGQSRAPKALGVPYQKER